MQINFLAYFQIEAAAKGNVPFLLNLDLVVANAAIGRQEQAEGRPALERTRSFENEVEKAYQNLNAPAEPLSK